MDTFNKRAAILGAGCVLLAAAPAVLSTYAYYVVASWMIFSIAAAGLNVPFGFTKLHCFGQGAFMLIGAYSMGMVIGVWGLPLWVGFALAILLAGCLGLLLALPTRKLKGFALAILTFTLALTLARTIKSLDFAGGPMGITIKPVSLFGLSPALFAYELTVLVFALSMLMLISLSSSKSGHAMRSVGSNEIVAQAIGVNPLRYRIYSMVIAAVYGAVAGCLQPLLVGTVAPDTYEPHLSIDLFAAVMIGGMGTIVGPLLGSLFIVLTPEFLQSSQQFSQMIFAAVFLFVTVFAPRGFVGIVEIVRRRLKGAGSRGDARGVQEEKAA
jgi:branched-chain amino acid transport system permease protein